MNITFRKSITEDQSEVNNLFIELVKTVNERMIKNGMEPYLGMENGFEKGYLDRFYKDDGNIIYVATDEDKIVGFISITDHRDENFIYLDDYCVNHLYRGQGIGIKLMDLAFEFARMQRVEEVKTHVVSTNFESIEFYKKYGFQIVEEEGKRLLIKKDANLSKEETNQITNKNNLIINRVLYEIKNKYSEYVDMVALAGSFCSGQFHPKSDCDLLIIINNKEAEKLSKCFILDGIGQDIYVSTWHRLKEMSKYKDHFVTKLIDLKMIYTRNDDVLKLYNTFQNELYKNMNNDSKIKKNIGAYLGTAVYLYNDLNNESNLNSFYVRYGEILSNIEKIIFLLNKKYLVGSTKSIPFEIMNMNILPRGFLDSYNNLIETNNTSEIINNIDIIISSLVRYFKDNNIEIIQPTNKDDKKIDKKEIDSNALIGTYEELYSNYYNKLHHAVNINNKYLSLRSMMGAQEFLDYFSDNYNIDKINLVDKYNPDDLKQNALEFENCLAEWKQLYDLYGITPEIYYSIDELYKEKTIKK